MGDNLLNYGQMMQRAFRAVMSDALGQVAEFGLPGDHHFYITFDTTHPGVVAPDWLKAENPDNLSIILQYEYKNLAVTEDRFGVTLTFQDRPAELVVPFDAVRTFADPSAEFGLRFDQHDPDEDEEADDEPAEFPESSEETGERPEGDAEIVSLESWRKK